MDIKIKNQDKLKDDVSLLMEEEIQDSKAILQKTEEIADGFFLETDKVDLYKQAGDKLAKANAVDEAISCYYHIFKLNVNYVDEVKKLVRLCYEKKKSLKIALRIISECLDNSSSDDITIQYLCEWLRAIRSMPNVSYARVEEIIYERLAEFSGVDEEAKVKNGVSLLSGIFDFVDCKDYECIHRLIQIFKDYEISHPALQNALMAIEQLVNCMEMDMVHEVIPLYIADNISEENRERIDMLLETDGEAIAESLLFLKEQAPLYWQKERKLVELGRKVTL